MNKISLCPNFLVEAQLIDELSGTPLKTWPIKDNSVTRTVTEIGTYVERSLSHHERDNASIRFVTQAQKDRLAIEAELHKHDLHYEPFTDGYGAALHYKGKATGFCYKLTTSGKYMAINTAGGHVKSYPLEENEAMRTCAKAFSLTQPEAYQRGFPKLW